MSLGISGQEENRVLEALSELGSATSIQVAVALGEKKNSGGTLAHMAVGFALMRLVVKKKIEYVDDVYRLVEVK